MTPSDEELRDLFQQGARTAMRDECIPPEQLASLAANEVSDENRRDLALHLIKCADCAEEYRCLREIGRWANAEAANIGSSAAKSPFWGRTLKIRLRFILLPAAAAVVVGFSIWALQSGLFIEQEQPIVTRGTIGPEMKTDPERFAVLSEAPKRLSWIPLQEGSVFKAVIYDHESTVVWESVPAKSTEVEIPSEIRTQLKPGNVYYWRVFSYNGISRQSELFRFTLNKMPE